MNITKSVQNSTTPQQAPRFEPEQANSGRTADSVGRLLGTTLTAIRVIDSLPTRRSPSIFSEMTGIFMVVGASSLAMVSMRSRAVDGGFLGLPRSDLSGGAPFSLAQFLNQTFEASSSSRALAAAKSIRDNLPEITTAVEGNCSVCFDELSCLASRKIVKLECDHHFHKECILPWLQGHNRCPNCRHPMESDDPEWNRDNSDKLTQAKAALAKSKEQASAPAEKPPSKE